MCILIGVLGDHEIHVNVNGVDVTGSPFTCRVYDPAQILVGQIPDGLINKPVHFTGNFKLVTLMLQFKNLVDASNAGVGNLEVRINNSLHFNHLF